jgi:hypothetical protein
MMLKGADTSKSGGGTLPYFFCCPPPVLWPCTEPQTSTELQHREHVLEVLVSLYEEEPFLCFVQVLSNFG